MGNTPTSLKTFLLRLTMLLFVLLCGMFVTFLLYFAVLLLQNGFDLNTIAATYGSMMTDPNQIRILQTLQSFCIFIIPPFILCRVYGVEQRHFLSLKLPNLKTALLGMLSIVVLSPMLNVLVVWNEGLHLPASMQGIEQWMRDSENAAKIVTDRLMAGTSVVDLLMNLLIVGALAGIGEELFFRGTLLRIVTDVLKNHTGSKLKPWAMHVAIWTIAFVFSAIHLQFFGFFPRLVLGAWFGYLLWWTGSIWVPVLAHFTNNTLSTIVVFSQNKGWISDDPDRWGMDQTWWLSVISLILGTLITLFFLKSSKNKSITG